jgi:phosphoribosylanthranilate isomerase
MFIKVCGIRTRDQIDWAVDLGYTAVGFVLHPESPRFRDAETALRLVRYARGRIATVAVGLTFSEVELLCDECDYLQLYEYRNRDRLIFAGDKPPPPECGCFLYDAGRGDGQARDMPAWLSDFGGSLIISGGLSPSNVGGIIRRIRPFGVDVSSGVERERGIKNFQLMRQFMEEVRNAIE